MFKKQIFVFFASLFFYTSLFGQAAPIITVADKEEWKKFESKENGFSVDLPTTPEHVQQSIDVPKSDLQIRYDTYISEPSSDAVYVISVWYYPQEIDMSQPEVNLKDGFQGMVSALPGAKVEKMEIDSFKGFKSLEFLVKHEDIYFQGKLILVYNTLYQVFTVYKEGVEMKDNYKKFMGTFKLLNPEQNKVEGPNAKKMNVMLESF